LGIAEPHQVDGDAAPPVFCAVDDMAPVITVDRNAVDEQRHRPLSPCEIGDASGFDVGKAAAGVKSRDVHGLWPRWLRRPFRTAQCGRAVTILRNSAMCALVAMRRSATGVQPKKLRNLAGCGWQSQRRGQWS